MDTVYALASAPGKAGVAVVRVSGCRAHQAAERLSGAPIPGRGMRVRSLRGGDGQTIDDAVVLSFSAPASFTGEDIVEFQIHGSGAGIRAVLRELGQIAGLRMAEPGEFVRRALENGKLDLSQVEGLADLIDAETEIQRRQAHRVFSGVLGQRADRWRDRLIRAASLVEASIDFVDEDVPVDVSPEVAGLLTEVSAELRRELVGTDAAERIRAGFEVAIVGAPNTGKSTLLNALAGRAAAITSAVAGTTRDVIELRMDISGLPVTFLDMAGLRESTDEVEALGIGLARRRAEEADLRVFLSEDGTTHGIVRRSGDIVLKPKADLRDSTEGSVSGLTGLGVSTLLGRIGEELAHRCADAGVATHERHRVAMEAALSGLGTAGEMLDEGPWRYDLVSEEIRAVIRSLEALVGRVDVENLLDGIFSRFCIGK